MKSWVFAVVGLGIVAFHHLSENALATTGGPTIIDDLGFDTIDRKIFFQKSFLDETARHPAVFYLDLKSSFPTKPVPIASWYKEVPDIDRDVEAFQMSHEMYERNIGKLRSRLKPLRIVPTGNIAVRTKVKKLEKVRNKFYELEPISQFTIQVNVEQKDLSAQVELVTYNDSKIRLVGAYQYSGEPWLFAVLRFISSDNEGWEEDVAVLLMPRHRETLEGDNKRLQRTRK